MNIEVLDERRIRLGLSFGELSEKTGYSKSVLQRYFTGAVKKIPSDRLEAIADALGMDIRSLYDGAENEERNGEKEMVKEKKREAEDMLTMEVEEYSFPGGTPWFHILPKEYNIILSIVAVTRKPIEDVVYDLLRYAISRTKVISNGKTLLDVSQIYEK